MANIRLNADPFKKAFIDLENAKQTNPSFTDASLMAYVTLSTILEVSINWKMGVIEIQETLDEKTLEYQKELLEILDSKVAEMENV
jgi:hypothetical protein